MVSVRPPLFSAAAKSSIGRMSWVSHDLRFWKLCWASVMMLFRSRCAVISDLTMYLRSSRQTLVREIGLQLAAWLWLPFFNTGCARACFQISGISLVRKEQWNSAARAGASSFATACRRRQEILSGPAAFLWLRFCSSFEAPLIHVDADVWQAACLDTGCWWGSVFQRGENYGEN